MCAARSRRARCTLRRRPCLRVVAFRCQIMRCCCASCGGWSVAPTAAAGTRSITAGAVTMITPTRCWVVQRMPCEAATTPTWIGFSVPTTMLLSTRPLTSSVTRPLGRASNCTTTACPVAVRGRGGLTDLEHGRKACLLQQVLFALVIRSTTTSTSRLPAIACGCRRCSWVSASGYWRGSDAVHGVSGELCELWRLLQSTDAKAFAQQLGANTQCISQYAEDSTL